MKTASSSPNFNFGFPTAGPQSPTGSAVMDHIFFVSQSDWKTVREEDDFDFIIIGSGFCALGFAQRALAHNPLARILILERGPFFLPEHFQNLPLPYQSTIGGLSETFPWTLSSKTIAQPYFQWQHGMVPFFGGRSTLWSAWCPRPTPEEMRRWPKQVIEKANDYFECAERLLNVVPADKIEDACRCTPPVGYRPIYGVLQNELFAMLQKNLSKIPSATRVIPAPMAVGSLDGVDFEKYSIPGPLLTLVDQQRTLEQQGRGSPLKIATNCTVTQIVQQDGVATALETSRGVVSVGNAKLILAMGTVPPTTLVLNSFPQVTNAGKRFTSHFISAIIARIPRIDYGFQHLIGELELAAIYLAGTDSTTGLQYHIQLTALSDRDPVKNAAKAARYMPDVVATASKEQLSTSQDYVVFVCAVLGELSEDNPKSWLRKTNGRDRTTNVLLQALVNEDDKGLYETMEEGTFQALETVLSPKGAGRVEYWQTASKSWVAKRPPTEEIRVPGMVHESSTLFIGDDEEPDAAVGLDYRLKGVENVYVTGASLWPTAGSWNPTMTMVALAQHLADNLSKVELKSSKEERQAPPGKRHKSHNGARAAK